VSEALYVYVSDARACVYGERSSAVVRLAGEECHRACALAYDTGMERVPTYNRQCKKLRYGAQINGRASRSTRLHVHV
jgi:hypothetical protein